MQPSPITPPDAETRAWVENTLGRRIVRTRRLTGGITSVVHRLTIENAAPVVLRRYAQGETDRTASFVEQEACTLTQLADVPVPAPRLIAFDAAGEQTGDVSALLMTSLPGRLDLAPRDPDRFVREMAEQLARIHELDIDGRAFYRAVKPSEDRIPSRCDRSLWLRAVDFMSAGPPEFDSCFLHRDYQHFNLLWSRGRLVGVVDWPFASVGPREIDAGHCRLNLAVLFSTEWAEHFRVVYEAETGRALDPWWDIHAIWSFHDVWREFIPQQIAGRASVDLDGMFERVDQLLAAALDRA